MIHLRFNPRASAGGGNGHSPRRTKFGWFDLAGEMPPELLSPDRPVWEFLAGTR